jgi:hypothetical protein
MSIYLDDYFFVSPFFQNEGKFGNEHIGSFIQAVKRLEANASLLESNYTGKITLREKLAKYKIKAKIVQLVSILNLFNFTTRIKIFRTSKWYASINYSYIKLLAKLL